MDDTSYQKFLEDIAAIIATENRPSASCGSFKKIVFVDGKPVTYSFSWVVGTGSIHKGAEYRSQFGRTAPSWTDDLHPYCAWRLFQLAMDCRTSLPDVWPTSC